MATRRVTSADPRLSTEALISRLAGDARPVQRVWPPRARLLVWLALVSAVMLLAAIAIGFRSDIVAKLGEASFSTEIILLLAIGLANAALALLAAVPGREPARAVALGSFVVAILGLGAAYASEPAAPMLHPAPPFVAMGWPCAARTLAIAAVPWVVLLIAVRRGATLVPGLAGLLAGSGSFFVAAAALRMACPMDEARHLVVWHLGPVILGVAVSLALGWAWLSRWRASR